MRQVVPLQCVYTKLRIQRSLSADDAKSRQTDVINMRPICKFEHGLLPSQCPFEQYRPEVERQKFKEDFCITALHAACV